MTIKQHENREHVNVLLNYGNINLKSQGLLPNKYFRSKVFDLKKNVGNPCPILSNYVSMVYTHSS